jgi:hypothetical protein
MVAKTYTNLCAIFEPVIMGRKVHNFELLCLKMGFVTRDIFLVMWLVDPLLEFHFSAVKVEAQNSFETLVVGTVSP